MSKRLIEQRIRADFGKGKAIVVLGSRQVGKTPLLGQLVAGQEKVLSFNCVNADDREELNKGKATALKAWWAYCPLSALQRCFRQVLPPSQSYGDMSRRNGLRLGALGLSASGIPESAFP